MTSLVRAVVVMSGMPMPAMASSIRTYSSLCIALQSGDVAGWKVTIMPDRKTYRVRYDYSEGALMEPLVTDRVTYSPSSGRLTFQVRSPFGMVRFAGAAGSTDLVGRLREAAVGQSVMVTLKAVPADWGSSRFPTCPDGRWPR